ncbi:MAG: hypothetical protein DRI87_07030 [Bacteroidetes bacterium]|nr:MAG: hypothetical protein DRI87_07030 [Bacteroidota bacterium]
MIRKVGVSKRKAFLASLKTFFLFFCLCLQAVNAKKQKARHCVQGFSFVGVAGLTSLIRKRGVFSQKNRIRSTHLFFCFSFSLQTSLHLAETEKPHTVVRGFFGCRGGRI